MRLIDVRWNSYVNMLTIACDRCAIVFVWPSNIGLVECPICRQGQLWHSVEPKPNTGPWSEPVMENCVRSFEVD
jgi:uncharacterized Zn finger protein (UPF0148 family)